MSTRNEQRENLSAMSEQDAISWLGQRLRGELDGADIQKDLSTRETFEQFREWYWTTHLALDEVPEKLHEEEIGFMEKTLPKLAAAEVVQKVIESKKARGLWVVWTPPRRVDLMKTYPKRRVWALWEARLAHANTRMLDGSGLVAQEIDHADAQGRILNVRESPDFEPFPPWQPIMLARYGSMEAAVPFPRQSGAEFKMVETDADQRRWDAQRKWYENTWAGFMAEMILALVNQERHPRGTLAEPPGPTVDQSLIAKARDAFISAHPHLNAQRTADLETAKMRGGAEGELIASGRWVKG